MLDAIASVDWYSVPGPADLYRPVDAWSGLRDLARARGHSEAASAASRLAGGGIIHDHSGTVFPSAVLATPILLRIAEHGNGTAQAAALELIEESLLFRPWPRFARTEEGVRLCCAIAGHVHTCAQHLAALGSRSRSLLTTAGRH